MNVTSVKEIFSIDIRSAALFRMFVAAYILLDAVNRITLVPAFYSDAGVYPRQVVLLDNYEFAYHFQLMFLSGSEWFSYLFFSILLIAGLCLLLGYKTRVATVVCWLLFCSAIVRDGVTANSGDILLIQLLFWGMFLPLGAKWSLDGKRKEQKHEHSKTSFSAATVGLYVQFVLLYITTGYFKGQYLSWVDGTHMYITFSRFEFMKPIAFLIYPHYELLSFMTWFTLILELFGPLLFFVPVCFLFFRMTGIFLFAALQIGVAVMMNVGFFPISSLAGIVVFLPSAFWDLFREKLFGAAKELKSEGNMNAGQYPATGRTGLWLNTALSRVIVYVTLWNISELPNRFLFPEKLKNPGYYLKLDQRWAMYSSTPYYSEYYSVMAYYSDGSSKDLLKTYTKEFNSSDEFRHVVFRNFRWRKFLFERIHSRDYHFIRPLYLD